MKMEESTFTQDNDNKQTERIKVSEIDIIVSMINGKPYKVIINILNDFTGNYIIADKFEDGFQELSQILIVKNYNEAIQLLKDKGLLYET